MSQREKKALITEVTARSPFAESFRTMRTNINFAALDNPYRTILATSPGPGEGKTVNICNLGIVLAQANYKVLIIDNDMRRPSVHKMFDLSDVMGVTNILVDEWDLLDVARETGVPGLHVLPSGPIPPNPAEIMGTQRMKSLIDKAAQNFDYVLIDAPPVIMVTDAVLLSTFVDGVLLVLKSNSTRIDAAKEARDKLQNIGVKIIGTVLNKVDVKGKGYYYYYYYTNE